MKILPRGIRKYFNQTHSLWYSYLVSLPLLILYELLILISQPDHSSIIRISVDVWIKQLFHYTGYNTLWITLLLAVIIGLIIYFRNQGSRRPLRTTYFLGMILESVCYAVVLALLIGNFLSTMLQIVSAASIDELPMIQQIALSLGAGLYEELFFRVFLIFVLYKIFMYIFNKSWQSYFAAALLGALIFSLAHYTGVLGDPFTLGSFLYRFLFGLALNGLYIWRGFGVAAWTHASYDIMVVAFL